MVYSQLLNLRSNGSNTVGNLILGKILVDQQQPTLGAKAAAKDATGESAS